MGRRKKRRKKPQEAWRSVRKPVPPTGGPHLDKRRILVEREDRREMRGETDRD